MNYLMNESLINKWSPYLEGVDNKWERNLIAVCMENVTNHLNNLQEAGDEPVGRFSRYAVPLARRVLHNLAVSNLISVQPLAQPDGKIFYLDFVYGDNFTASNPNITANENIAVNLNKNYTKTDMNTKGATARKIVTSFTSKSVSAIPRKIVGDIFVEDEQDLYTYYGLNGETEMLKAIATQIVREQNAFTINITL